MATTVPIQDLKLPELKTIAEMYGITRAELSGNAAKKQTWIDAITAAAKKEEAAKAAKTEETAPPDTLFDLTAYATPVHYTDWADSMDVEGEDDDELLPLRRSVPPQPEPQPEPELEPESPPAPEKEDEGKLYGWDLYPHNPLTAEQAAFRFNVGDVVFCRDHSPRNVGEIIKFTTVNGYPNMPLVRCEDGVERFLPPQLMELLPVGQLALPLTLDLDDFDVESDWDSSFGGAIAVMERDCDRAGKRDQKSASMLSECDRTDVTPGPIAEAETIENKELESFDSSALRDRQGRENECDRIMDERLASALIADGFSPVKLDDDEEPVWEECVGDHAFIAIPLQPTCLDVTDAYGNVYRREYADGELDQAEFDRVKLLVHISSEHLSVSSERLSVSSEHLSTAVTNYPSPITNYQLPANNYQLPITNYQLPANNLLLRGPPAGAR